MEVYLRHPRSGERRRMKSGWSWTLFLFSFATVGLLFALRGMWAWAMYWVGLMVGFGVWATSHHTGLEAGLPYYREQWIGSPMMFSLFLGLSIFVGIKGNALTGRFLLRDGWEFEDADGEAVKKARERWGLDAKASA